MSACSKYFQNPRAPKCLPRPEIISKAPPVLLRLASLPRWFPVAARRTGTAPPSAAATAAAAAPLATDAVDDLETALSDMLGEIYNEAELKLIAADMAAAMRCRAGEGGEEAEDLFDEWATHDRAETLEPDVERQERRTLQQKVATLSRSAAEAATARARASAELLLSTEGAVAAGTSVEELLGDEFLNEVCGLDDVEEAGLSPPLPPPAENPPDESGPIATEVIDGPEITKWASECSVGLDLLSDASASHDARPLGYRPTPTDVSDIALVEHTTGTGNLVRCFVHWQDPSAKMGRRCRADTSHHNVQLVYPTGVPLEDFSRSKILHSAIGVGIRRARGMLRTVVPKHIVRMRDMWDVLRGSTPDAFATCCVCKDDLDASAQTCSLCCLAWHDSCSLTFAASLGDRPTIAKIVASCPTIPRDFKDEESPLCHACRAVAELLEG